MDEFRKYDVIFGKFPIEEEGFVQCGERPAIIIQNNTGNKFSPTLLVLPLTSRIKKINMPTHMIIERDNQNGLDRQSMLIAEQPKVINKKKCEKIGRINDRNLQRKILRCYIYSAAYNDEDFRELNLSQVV